MTPEQIERLREWHRTNIKSIQNDRGMNIFCFCTDVLRIPLARSWDSKKLYLNGRLISDLSEEKE